jgi:hypothetical protein
MQVTFKRDIQSRESIAETRNISALSFCAYSLSFDKVETCATLVPD